MKKGYTHILMICDRSASMEDVAVEASSAINAFIAEQRLVEGECKISFFQFDTAASGWNNPLVTFPEQVYDGDISGWTDYTLVPRGSTALLDAIGIAVTNLGVRFAAMDEDDRPEHVVVVVQTDGQENSSREWTTEKVAALIKQQTDDYNWDFVFLGMGPDTWDIGKTLNFNNTVSATGTGQSYGSTYDVLTASVSTLRSTGKRIDGVDEHTS